MERSSRESKATPQVLLMAIAVSVAGLLVVGAFAFGGQADPLPASNATPTPSPTSSTAPTELDDLEDDNTVISPTPFSTTVLPDPMSGQEAIDALGDKITVVADRNNMTVDELTDLLLRDTTAHISTSGHIFYRDDFGGATP